MAVGGLLAIFVGLAIIDERVRRQLLGLTDRRLPTGEVASIGTYLRDTAFVVMGSARDLTIDHAPEALFTVAAVVLTIFMLRTRI